MSCHSLEGQLLRTIASAAAPAGQTLANFSGTFGTFDPTKLKNGPYLIRLTAADQAGHQSTLDRLVHVDGRLKLGNFTLSFTDLTIPVAGIPITITRTYIGHSKPATTGEMKCSHFERSAVRRWFTSTVSRLTETIDGECPQNGD